MARSEPAWLLATVMALAPIAAHAGNLGSPSPAAAIAQQGDTRGIPPCASCHGAAGEGNAAAGFPRLVGLPAAYLAAQLDELASGVRQSPVMGPLARNLNEQERRQLAEYYAALPLAPAGAGPAKTVPSDDRLALRGRWSEDIPSCVQCHGEGGSGVGSAFPPLAGQSVEYLANQLRAWKQGTRRGDPLGLMQAVASRLSDDDIRSVSEYFAAQPITHRVSKP